MNDLERRIAEGLRARAEEIMMDVETVSSRSLQLQRRLDGVERRRRTTWLVAAACSVLVAGAVAVGWSVLDNGTNATQVPANESVPTVLAGELGAADAVLAVGDQLWVAPAGEKLIRAVDPASGKTVHESAVPDSVAQLVSADSTVYALSSGGDRLLTLGVGEQGRPELRASVSLEIPTASVVASGGGLYGYETDLTAGTAYRIDPTRGTNLGRAAMGGGDAEAGSGESLLAPTPDGVVMATATGVVTYTQALISEGRVNLEAPVLAVIGSSDGRVFASTADAVFLIDGRSSTLLGRAGGSRLEWLPGAGRVAVLGPRGVSLIDPEAKAVTGTTTAPDVADGQHLVRAGGELYVLTRSGRLTRVGSGLGG